MEQGKVARLQLHLLKKNSPRPQGMSVVELFSRSLGWEAQNKKYQSMSQYEQSTNQHSLNSQSLSLKPRQQSQQIGTEAFSDQKSPTHQSKKFTTTDVKQQSQFILREQLYNVQSRKAQDSLTIPLTPRTRKALSQLNLTFKDVLPKRLEDFLGPDQNYQIARTEFQLYQINRKNMLEQIQQVKSQIPDKKRTQFTQQPTDIQQLAKQIPDKPSPSRSPQRPKSQTISNFSYYENPLAPSTVHILSPQAPSELKPPEPPLTPKTRQAMLKTGLRLKDLMDRKLEDFAQPGDDMQVIRMKFDLWKERRQKLLQDLWYAREKVRMEGSKRFSNEIQRMSQSLTGGTGLQGDVERFQKKRENEAKREENYKKQLKEIQDKFARKAQIAEQKKAQREQELALKRQEQELKLVQDVQRRKKEEQEAEMLRKKQAQKDFEQAQKRAQQEQEAAKQQKLAAQRRDEERKAKQEAFLQKTFEIQQTQATQLSMKKEIQKQRDEERQKQLEQMRLQKLKENEEARKLKEEQINAAQQNLQMMIRKKQRDYQNKQKLNEEKQQKIQQEQQLLLEQNRLKALEKDQKLKETAHRNNLQLEQRRLQLQSKMQAQDQKVKTMLQQRNNEILLKQKEQQERQKKIKEQIDSSQQAHQEHLYTLKAKRDAKEQKAFEILTQKFTENQRQKVLGEFVRQQRNEDLQQLERQQEQKRKEILNKIQLKDQIVQQNRQWQSSIKS